MSLWTSTEIATATAGVASADFEVTGVAFDSREVGPGDLFVALSGETTDGHRFLDQAFAQGAAGAIVSAPTDHPHVRVADSFAALNDLARASRARTDATIVGVTGSVGKTSAKEALFAALDRSMPGRVHRSVKSYNNHTGVPLSLARMPRDARIGVFEMGMNHAGELAALTRIVRPDVAIVTTVASVHIEFFADEAGIADAKAEIFEGLEPGGVAIVPFDNPHRDRLVAVARAHAGRVVTTGTGEGADARAVEVMRVATGGSFVTARIGDSEVSFTLAQPGAHWVSNALTVLAAVDAVGADLAQAALALAEMGGLPGRGARFVAKIAGGEALVMDESYNASPLSMRATLTVLADELGRHVAILGEMGELGDATATYHRDLADPIRGARVDTVLLVGESMRVLAEALEGTTNVVHVRDVAAALDRLDTVLAPGDTVLVKGSNRVGLSRVIARLKGGTT
ncbi:UDP-N-acetylmuramoyl-tripeptide--D-alanyl-D-alanine ligase [Sphingomonas oligophenolica]|uniref:UDP-N-acetylmuramoyl-tripeptide--D-alanyl-D-alanine ligase n=1 Tax=Sphingomonas oligophenolica TaxID=301154 RepID=A0A502CIU6_9SPHN|nr:UDP-N-acetylmuramoyl-tripeptide--D-alanyl-D-alanine ligase [Sphingomonas oligophenolica]TPG13107.1 UDP-N-acetylmuramoyl-tripeptide--D-alanyl-D-alanine ligase [Sphingomonas oligophenolica]